MGPVVTGEEEMDADVVSAESMRERVAAGEAKPLLAGFDPVPTWYRDAWWHVPADGEDYVEAGPDLVAQLDALRARVERIDAFEQNAEQ